MNFNKLVYIAGLLSGGSYCILMALDQGVKYAAKESFATLLKTSALFFPLAIVVEIATKKIFDDFGWQTSPIRSIVIYTITIVNSTILASAAAVGFGFTNSRHTAWMVSLIAIELLIGTFTLLMGTSNIFNDLQDGSNRLIRT